MPSILLTRADLTKLFPNDTKAVIAFERLFFQAQRADEGVTASVDATQALADATIITLSPNTELNNERVLAVDPNTIALTDNGPNATLVIGLVNNVMTQGGFSCVFNLASDTALDLPASGTVLTDAFLSEGPFADDAAAGLNGVPLNRPYRRTDGVVAWRQA